jgi:formylglycine-generating enzyme required for sulfatase activity
MRALPIALALALLLPLPALGSGAAARNGDRGAARVRIEGGSYRPLYTQRGETAVSVGPFLIDERAVTRAEFRTFLAANARWQRDAVPGVFADENYLASWGAPGPADADMLATEVSWFAARAYCRWVGGRLPMTHEWELLARADEHDRDAADRADFLRRALDWALAPAREAPTVRSGFRSVWGVWGLHGAVNEWVLDFNTSFASVDSRETTEGDRLLTCAAGATANGDARDYAAFMRYAFRAAADARSTARNLGFRCAQDLP